MPRGNYHPSRISNRQKLIRQRDTNKLLEKPKKPPLEKIDISKSDWSKK